MHQGSPALDLHREEVFSHPLLAQGSLGSGAEGLSQVAGWTLSREAGCPERMPHGYSAWASAPVPALALAPAAAWR